MKIAIATDDFKKVTGHVGRCGGFLVVEVQDGNIISKEERVNNFTNHGNGGHGEHKHHHEEGNHKPGHERLAEGLNDCSHLICAGLGWRLVEDLKTYKIEPILTREEDAELAAVKLEKGELEVDEDLTCHSH